MSDKRKKMAEDVLQRLGERVRELREHQGVSQDKLAAFAGLDRTYVGGIERGERNVAVVNLARLAKALKVTPSELLKGITWD